jgi:hypothetical protein
MIATTMNTKRIVTILSIATLGVIWGYQIKEFNDLTDNVLQSILIFIAAYAASQVKAAVKQNSLTTQKIAIDELREFSKFLVEAEKLSRKIKDADAGFKRTRIEMGEFTATEALLDERFEKEARYQMTFYSNHPELQIDLMKCSNSLEVICAAFETQTADLNVAKNSIASALCAFVEENSYTYINHRTSATMLYQNTINLYKKLKTLAGTLEEGLKKLEKEIQDINDKKSLKKFTQFK